MVATTDSSGTHSEMVSPDRGAADLPPAMDPLANPALESDTISPIPSEDDDPDDIFKLSPDMAMEYLGSSIEALVNLTGDVQPTPPAADEPQTNMREIREEKVKLVRSLSERSLRKLQAEAQERAAEGGKRPSDSKSGSAEDAPSGSGQESTTEDVDDIYMNTPKKKKEISDDKGGAPVIGENAQAETKQLNAVGRKFYAKRPPPISITDYLARLHHYCPMSTGVYLATSLYMHRLAVEEGVIAVTRRNCHRLVLGGLRVAMKLLEDRCYAHSMIAKVGGVGPTELGRLEVNFCFLTNFELLVDEKMLREHWRSLRLGRTLAEMETPTIELSLRGLKRLEGECSKGHGEGSFAAPS